MKSILKWYTESSTFQWDYYQGIGAEARVIVNPFILDQDYNHFIETYFARAGKIDVFDYCQYNLERIRLPNHICSVFFLGICIYNNTSLQRKYHPKNNAPGYQAFPFIWFLIALFHDNAYEMESKGVLNEVETLEQLYTRFDVEYRLLDKPFTKCLELAQARNSYFRYVKTELGVVDHGILGGILLYDRLMKIRKLKSEADDNKLFWGIKLANQYKLAANAITLHNLWLPNAHNLELYQKYEIDHLAKAKPVTFKDFPLFYILALVDTIEPLKAYKTEIASGALTSLQVLESFDLSFGDNWFKLSLTEHSILDMDIVGGRISGLNLWIDVGIESDKNSVTLTFR